MPSMDWDKLRIFYVTADAGSFTRAGDRLNLSQSAVSRQIGALEDRLGVPLFHRHARGLILTEQGEILFQAAREIYSKVEVTEGRLRDAQGRPSGLLRISTTRTFGSFWLARNIGDFIHQYPEIDVQIRVTDAELDIAMREADVAIRLHPPHQPDLIQRVLGQVDYHIYASPAYLERRGQPQRPEDLDNHDLIIWGPNPPPLMRELNWIVKVGASDRQRRPILRINNIYGILQAVESGLGLASLPDYFAQASDRIVRVLPELDGPTFTAYFSYPSELKGSKRIEVFRDFLVKKLRETGF